MTAPSCLRVAVCVSAPVMTWCYDIVPPGHHGRWHAAGPSRAAWPELGGCCDARRFRGRGSRRGEDFPLAATTVKGRTRAAMTTELLAAAIAATVAWYRTRPGTP